MNKKTVLFLATILLLSSLAYPVLAKNPNKDMGMPPSYVLNILAKKNFTTNDMTTSPDRHTIFVPLDGEAKIFITQASPGTEADFQVTDANAVHDGEAHLELAQGYYKVYMAALGKPAKNPDQYADIWGIVENTDYDINVLLAEFKISRNKGGPDWEDTTMILYMTWDEVYEFFYEYYLWMYNDGQITIPGTWTGTVTEYLEYLADLAADETFAFFEGLGLVWNWGEGPCIWVFDFFEYVEEIFEIMNNKYYWLIKNNGVRHIQVRFYKVDNRNWEFPG
jgi:hypothetical protein